MSLAHPRTLGADLRAVRRARGLTLQETAERLDRSVGWLSQVERDLSEPSITDLRHIAAVLGVPVSTLFAQSETAPDEQGLIVRKASRRPIGSGTAGLIEELLSPDLTDDFEVVHCTFAAQSRIGEPVSRPTQEVGYLIAGQLDLVIAGQSFSLSAGDSFRIRGEVFEWRNPHDTPAQAIWVIAPPVY